ncbi:hypothetical protein [Sphingomonas sp. ID0503]|uniref:hypothetical protein n=1 Tax=Sphingomonas sp. ID0503 TaxID=3399691 RepID=UPI003AFA741A
MPDLFRCDAEGCAVQAEARVERGAAGFIKFAWMPDGWIGSNDDAPEVHLCPAHAFQTEEMAA